MEGVSFVGATVSNSVTGLFINAYRFAIPYWLALGCLLASFLYVVFVLPESLPEVLRRRDLTLQASFTSYPKSVWRVLTRARPNRWKISLGIPGNFVFFNVLSFNSCEKFVCFIHNRHCMQCVISLPILSH